MKSGFSGLEMGDSHHSRRIPPLDLKNRRTFTPFTTDCTKLTLAKKLLATYRKAIERKVQGRIPVIKVAAK